MRMERYCLLVCVFLLVAITLIQYRVETHKHLEILLPAGCGYENPYDDPKWQTWMADEGIALSRADMGGKEVNRNPKKWYPR